MALTYDSEKFKEMLADLRRMTDELPRFCAEYFRGTEQTTLVRSRVAYATDLKLFFAYLATQSDHKRDDPKSFTLADLDSITVDDIESFLSYVTMYTGQHRYGDDLNVTMEYMNGERAKARKLASIRSLYRYFLKKGSIKNNPSALVDTPAIRDRAIVRLEPDEVAILLDTVENGQGLTGKQLEYHEHTKERDLAILTLFLGTGIRISELVGIDIDDINFSANEFCIMRKGGKQDILVFGEEARTALLSYMLKREKMLPVEGHEEALFLSLQMKRLTVRAVENLVKKYAKIVTPLKNISPHKLRSTFGTQLYRETEDIYLVADVLGHKDVNTTRKHYAALSQDARRTAAHVIKLRED